MNTTIAILGIVFNIVVLIIGIRWFTKNINNSNYNKPPKDH